MWQFIIHKVFNTNNLLQSGILIEKQSYILVQIAKNQ